MVCTVPNKKEAGTLGGPQGRRPERGVTPVLTNARSALMADAIAGREAGGGEDCGMVRMQRANGTAPRGNGDVN